MLAPQRTGTQTGLIFISAIFLTSESENVPNLQSLSQRVIYGKNLLRGDSAFPDLHPGSHTAIGFRGSFPLVDHVARTDEEGRSKPFLRKSTVGSSLKWSNPIRPQRAWR